MSAAKCWTISSLILGDRAYETFLMVSKAAEKGSRAPNRQWCKCTKGAGKRRAGSAHESFSGNSMSAYRILEPGVLIRHIGHPGANKIKAS